ncbi:protein kinase A catalytic subunit [Mucor lusitanicus CBS 277.49]|uniref:cAMP-dependent protein kinase n=1 Tax=Mucor lusitanicus CBS 277.49 TaxID=747725 RepID=A0A168K953_MUCCL|nr:protein kinase A catalytic subunit [Mucor lusitanicus CBS 277.49]
MSKTPSITSSITSDEGSCYSGGFSNIHTPGRNSASNSPHMPASITITPMISSPPQSPVNNKNNFKASPLSPLPQSEDAAAPDGYFSIQPSTSSDSTSMPDNSSLSPLGKTPATGTSADRKNPCNEGANSVSAAPRSPMKSHFSPRPKHVTRISTHAVPRARAPNNIKQRRQKHRKLRLDDFVLKRTVGTGSFGRVHLAQSKVNGKHYAIKALDKYDVVRLKQVEHINNEPTILREISHPFLVTLWDAFQDDSHLFMVMDYVPGGELFSILRKQKKFSEQTAKFYAAEVLLALAYLHENGIVYRDLKPENILIDARGHVKLTDFGFAKRVDDMTWTVCGTPDYLAPEIILSKGYTKAVDWWGLGVLIFEMVVGRAPFIDKNPVNLYQKILECRVDWPEDMSADLKDLLQNLLTADIEGRYTSQEIKEHVWFADLNFDQVLKRKVKPPYIPKVKDDGDTTCFAKYKEPVHLYGNIKGDPFRSKFPAF